MSLGQTLNTAEEVNHGEFGRKAFWELKTQLSFLKHVSGKAQKKGVC